MSSNRKVHRLGQPRVHGDVPPQAAGAFEEVYALVRSIPRGRVMTYGQIATELANRLSPRAVGWALHGCPGDVPWQRVVNAQGRCSTDRLHDVPPGFQQALLSGEGVAFDDTGRLELETYRWHPPAGSGRPEPDGERRSEPR
jgi:methylated-DNA-protein-cysteine methyltransferase-like protein